MTIASIGYEGSKDGARVLIFSTLSWRIVFKVKSNAFHFGVFLSRVGGVTLLQYRPALIADCTLDSILGDSGG